MKRLLCRFEAIKENYFSLSVWLLRMQGVLVEVSGHVVDDDTRHYEIRDGREIELFTCARCGTEIEAGWRYMGL